MPPKRPRRSSITLPIKRPKTSPSHPDPPPRDPHRITSAPPPPPAPFPPSGATAYTSVSGPIQAGTLRALTALRLRPDYESCNPSLTDAQLRMHWDFSHAALPRAADDPLRVPDVNIEGEWDMYKLRALVEGSREDIEVLNGAVVDAEREVHDVDRKIEDARRMGCGCGVDSVIEFWAPRVDGYSRWRCLQVSTGKYEVDAEWDVGKLQEVFSAAQRDTREGSKVTIWRDHVEM
ncbi:hypothetical protein CkaCkLH20_09331 [Colletotrichum karsti]|uniref:Uncharacterized protein n=1 Tax=Colletotrichum karsti TaxID=1095194 RepID=A0A9P6HYG9_9PEZI|nr:uncharacterized protein CkaCkLH20_09331 [Colletotrichum karsti]KAF9873168.1 hypothetical protein CkaCkLH20_09331 [Colletotrichum karsti]